MKGKQWQSVGGRGVAIATTLLSVCLISCKTLPKTVTVTEYKTQIQHDTIMEKDSVTVFKYVYLQGDTVHDVQIQYRDRWRERVVRSVQVDSVPYPVEVVVEKQVTRPMSGWQRFIYGSGYAVWGVIILITITAIVWFILKLKRKI